LSHWDRKEVEILQKLVRNYTTLDGIDKVLIRRNKDEIKQMMRMLGIVVTDECIDREKLEEYRPFYHYIRRYWTKEEYDILRETYPYGFSWEDILDLLPGRTLMATKQRIILLRLRREYRARRVIIPEGLVCPECGSHKIQSMGSYWQCKECARWFVKLKRDPQRILGRKDLTKLYIGIPLNENQKLIEGKEL